MAITSWTLKNGENVNEMFDRATSAMSKACFLVESGTCIYVTVDIEDWGRIYEWRAPKPTAL